MADKVLQDNEVLSLSLVHLMKLIAKNSQSPKTLAGAGLLTSTFMLLNTKQSKYTSITAFVK